VLDLLHETDSNYEDLQKRHMERAYVGGNSFIVTNCHLRLEAHSTSTGCLFPDAIGIFFCHVQRISKFFYLLHPDADPYKLSIAEFSL